MVKNGGIYKFVNRKSGTVIDFSGTDQRSVLGWNTHTGENQKWIFESKKGGYTIKNKLSGKYLAVDGEHKKGAKVIGTDCADTIWTVHEDCDDYVRIFIKGEEWNLDLSDHGNPANGTPITIYKKWTPGENQLWKLQPEEAHCC